MHKVIAPKKTQKIIQKAITNHRRTKSFMWTVTKPTTHPGINSTIVKIDGLEVQLRVICIKQDVLKTLVEQTGRPPQPRPFIRSPKGVGRNQENPLSIDIGGSNSLVDLEWHKDVQSKMKKKYGELGKQLSLARSRHDVMENQT